MRRQFLSNAGQIPLFMAEKCEHIFLKTIFCSGNNVNSFIAFPYGEPDVKQIMQAIFISNLEMSVGQAKCFFCFC